MSMRQIGLAILAFLAVLGFFLGVSGMARAETPPPMGIVERLASAQAPLQTKRGEPVDARELAEALNATCKGNRSWCALLLTLAAHESALDSRIARGECKPLECDGGRAWGLFQVHKNANNAEAWGSPDLVLQVREASRLARGAFERCKKSDVPFPLSTIRAYAGRG